MNLRQLKNALDEISSTLSGMVNDPENPEHDVNASDPIIFNPAESVNLSRPQHMLNEPLSISITLAGMINSPTNPPSYENKFLQIRFKLDDNVSVPSKSLPKLNAVDEISSTESGIINEPVNRLTNITSGAFSWCSFQIRKCQFAIHS